MFERTFSGALGPYFAQIKQIGAGGNGRILSGVDTRFDFPVCIKRISVANKDECRATLREIRIRRRLRHENIVGLLNAIVSDGTDVSEITPVNFRDTGCIYLVQELLDADLRQVIESHTRLSDEYVKLFFYQLLRGLKYIHSANVLHCDLKPSNIMININSLQLMIGDFGHSMVLDPEYNHGNSVTVCSTSLWYKAPELILGTGQYSTASDVWAVGCILAEMLLGRPLFEGENNLEQLELIIHTINVNQKDQLCVREYLTEEANTMYSGQPKFPLQSKFQKVDFHAFHLLEHLLSFNPDDRVTTELALSHPFLQEYACIADEPVCLKPLHLEHEVDDFLEYTLKDLIVGECVALAKEQPRIHQQMSSYSSLTDLTKESTNSPCGSSSQSIDDTRGCLELKTVSEDYQELSNESEGNRFKVLEVLKEEHGSSSGESNGLATHEEGVSEAPLVLDQTMFSSSKWEKERHTSHKSGHRRHHHHRSRKQSEEAKSRRRKISQENKFQLKSPSSDYEPSFDASRSGSLPEIRIPGDITPENHVPRLNSLGDELSGSVSPKVEVCFPVPNLGSSVAMEAQDDKVQELISRSRQLIADQTAVMNDVPTLTYLCGSVSSNESPEVRMETEEEKTDCSKVEKNFISSSVGDLSVLSHHRSAVDLGVTEVIRRSQELLGVTEVIRGSQELFDVTDVARGSKELGVAEVVRRSQELLEELYTPGVQEEKNLVRNEGASVQDFISRSDQLLKANEIAELSENTPEQGPCAPDEKTSLAACASDTVNDLISRSEQFRKSYQVAERLETVERPANVNTLQPMLSDPYHFKESNRRMQELLEESHTLLSSLKTDRTLCPDAESKCEDHSGKNQCELDNINLENNVGFSERKATLFDESLAGIDSNEMKHVLDQAKNLLQESNELSVGDVIESAVVYSSMEDMEVEVNQDCSEKYTMEIDENMQGDECSHGKDSVIEVDFGKTCASDKEENTTVNKEYEYLRAISEGELKNLSRFHHQFVQIDSVPPVKSQQAEIFEGIEVKLSPPLKQQTFHFNCLAPPQCSSLGGDSKSTNNTVLDESGNCTLEENDEFHGFEQVLVKKRSNDTLSDDNNHKHFKNSGVISPDGTLTTEDGDPIELYDNSRTIVVQSGDVDDKQLCLNGIKTSTLDLNVDQRLNTDSKVDYENMRTENDSGKLGTHSPKYQTVCNRDRYSSRMIDEINSDDVVDKICGTTCRMENDARRLNSKNSAGLQNFYASIKINSIMRNRGRLHREKRHDTYPF